VPVRVRVRARARAANSSDAVACATCCAARAPQKQKRHPHRDTRDREFVCTRSMRGVDRSRIRSTRRVGRWTRPPVVVRTRGCIRRAPRTRSMRGVDRLRIRSTRRVGRRSSVVGRRSSVVVTVRRDASRGGVAVRGGVRRARCVGGVFARSRGVIHAQMHIVIISVVVVDDDDG